MRYTTLGLLATTALLAACSSSSSSPEGASPGAGTGGAAGAGAGGAGGSAELLAPPAAGEGVQFKMLTTLSPGQEIERCQFFAVTEDLYVKREDVRYTPGSHHLLLYTTPYTSIPTVDTHGNTKDTTGVMDCVDGAAGDWKINRVVGGAQSANAPAIVDLPDGVAMVIKAGTVVMLNTHYLNTTPDSLDVDARINLYTAKKETVTQEAGVIFFYNPFIHVPAHGMGTARMVCPVTQDITLVNAQSHMHRRGVGYEANLVDGTGAMMEQMYTNTKWEGVPVKQWDGGHQLKAGSFIDYHCDYNSSEDHDIFQGLTTKDEMCMFIGSYYPKNEDFEVCADAKGNQDFGGKWIGNGTASCLDTVLCLQKAGKGHPDACMTDACPAAADEIAAALKCFVNGGNQTTCKTELDACTAKSCN